MRTYAQALGLDATQLAQEFRAELGQAPATRRAAEPFEPADPKRVPSRLLAVDRAADRDRCWPAAMRCGAAARFRATMPESRAPGSPPALAAGPHVRPPPPPLRSGQVAAPGPRQRRPGPVVLTATEPVWLRVYEGNGGPRYVEKVMKSGETFTVPATAKDPQILTGRPQAIRVTVGNTVTPPLGTPQRTIADVSLLAPALLARAAAAPLVAPAAGTPGIARTPVAPPSPAP